MQRTPEPELMDDPAQARAYAEADFDAPNTAFVSHLEARLDLPVVGRVLDLGCGPGDILARLARRFPGWQLVGLDGSSAMLAHAAVATAPYAGRVRLAVGLVPEGLPEAAPFDLILSNSLLHHLHAPEGLWRMIRRLGRPGAAVFVADLLRPADEAAASAIVSAYSGDEPEILRRDFYHSLLAAFSVEEVRAQVEEAGLGAFHVEPVSDRHLVAYGHLP